MVWYGVISFENSGYTQSIENHRAISKIENTIGKTAKTLSNVKSSDESNDTMER